MAEYVEVMKQKKRMCNSILCCKCDIFHLSGEDIGNCSQFILNNPSDAEKIIMSWAEKHPKPVYPTWWKYLCMIGVIPDELGDKTLGEMTVYSLMNTHIQNDVGQKLGIEPEENV